MSKLMDLKESDLNNRNIGLVDISKVLHGLKIPFMLSDGVLLGAVREKSFIKWDWDVELSVKVEDIFNKSELLLESLKENGFILVNVTLDWKNYKICAEKLGTKYSLIGFYEHGDHRMRAAWLYPKIFFDQLEEYVFLGNKYMVPSPPENYLKFQYGDWKTPIRTANKRSYLTSDVYRENRHTVRLLLYLKNKFQRILSKLKIFFRSFFITRLYRENNFQKMYEYCLCEGINVLEIGTSDGREAALALKNYGSKIKSICIVEPDIKNLKISRRAISRYDKNKIVNYHNLAIGDFCGTGDFYINNSFSNLNSSFLSGSNIKKIEMEYITLEKYIKKINLETPLLIKMDIEGYEVDILDESKKFISSLNDVSILLEIHPDHYSKHRSMYELLDWFFENGFKPIMIESAGVISPSQFQGQKMKLISSDKTGSLSRGLYSCVDKEFVKYACSRNIQENINEYYMTSKIVRSLLITNSSQ